MLSRVIIPEGRGLRDCRRSKSEWANEDGLSGDLKNEVQNAGFQRKDSGIFRCRRNECAKTKDLSGNHDQPKPKPNPYRRVFLRAFVRIYEGCKKAAPQLSHAASAALRPGQRNALCGLGVLISVGAGEGL